MTAGRPSPGPAAWSTLVVVCLVSMLMSLNMSSLNIALPSITRHFDASQVEGSWLLLSYMVTSTACLLLFGRLSDAYDQRALYLGGLSVFAVASLLAGLAPSIEALIGLRVLAAVGGAVLLGNGATLIHDAFPRESLGAAMGFYAASFPVANLVGPSLGGAVVELAGWRWVFWANVPLGLVALAVGVRLLPRRDRPPGVRGGLDLRGNAVAMVVIVLLTTTISLVSDLGWGAPVVWGGLLTAVALLPVLARIERRSAHPVIDLATLRHDGIGRLFLAGFFTGAARFPVTVLISLYLQAMLHLNPAEAGLHLLPLPLGSIMASMSVGWLSRRCSARTISLLGAVVGQVGVVLLTGAVMADLSWLLAPALAVGGAGTGLFIGSNATALLESTPPDSLGVVNAMRLMVQNTGNVVSLALALTVLTAGLPGALRDSLLQATVPDGSDGPIRAGFTVALLFLCVLGAVAIAFSVSSRAAVLRGPAPARASKTAWPESLRSPARTPKTPVSTDSSHN